MTTTDIAHRLADHGVPLEVISQALDQPMAELARSLKRTVLTPEDEQLAGGMRQLAWRVHSEAMWILENGHPDQKMAIIRTVLSKTAGLIGQESTTSFEESRQAVARIFDHMTDIETAEKPLSLPTPETSSYVSPIAAAAGGTHHPGQAPEIDEDPLRQDDQQDWR